MSNQPETTASAATTTAPPGGAMVPFAPYQKFMVAVLAFLQFTIILDFMILSPLGALLMRDLHVPAARFGLVVSVYAFSAGAAGLLAAGFADRFDRKKMLLFFYTGFVLGTLLCGIAPSYEFLLAARMVTGLFGGVIGSIAFAIIADLFPPQMRGRVMGVVQTSFAASQVLGIPVALLLSNHWGWHAPFLMIVAVSSVVGVIIAARMRPVVGHLQLQKDRNAFRHVTRALTHRPYLGAYATTGLLITGGFMLMPFGSAFLVHNLDIHIDRLPIIYTVTGMFSIMVGPLVGRFADRVGRYGLFCVASVLSMIMVTVYTHLSAVSLGVVITANVILFIGVTSRMITASALVSMVADAHDRGAFMAVNSSIQQIAGGVASGVAGLIVAQNAQGQLQHYDTLGYVAVASMLVCIVLLGGVNRAVKVRLAAAAAGGPPR